METLIESGFCMLDFGSSRPASGAEHHYSHYWEMTLLREGRPPILHGAKVGVATVLVAELYAQLRQMTLTDVTARLALARLPDREDEMARIRAAYGDLAPEIAADQAPFLNLTQADFTELKTKILMNWDEIQAIAAQVPPPAQIAEWLRLAGGPVNVADLGLTAEEQALAEANGHYLRQRFTVRKLMNVMREGVKREM
jgi:glycerol-1-phosphate dehydrogenase [NAD(P)+]